MTEGERIKQLRKTIDGGMTLEVFGEKIGLKKSSLSQIENGVNSVTDQTRKSICREFHVSETWLRDGTGEMFAPKSQEEYLEDFFADVLNDPNDRSFKRILLRALASLPSEQWEALAAMMEAFVKANEEAERTGEIGDNGVAAAEAAYKEALSNAQKKKHSVSNTTEDTEETA